VQTDKIKEIFKRVEIHRGQKLIYGCVDISNLDLTECPNFTNIRITGDFFSRNNKFTSMKGFPRFVDGHVLCDQFTFADYRKYLKNENFVQKLDKETGDLFEDLIITM